MYVHTNIYNILGKHFFDTEDGGDDYDDTRREFFSRHFFSFHRFLIMSSSYLKIVLIFSWFAREVALESCVALA